MCLFEQRSGHLPASIERRDGGAGVLLNGDNGDRGEGRHPGDTGSRCNERS
jgi:hypothetical protein